MQTNLKNYKPLINASIITIILVLLVQFACRNEQFTHTIYPSFYAKFYPLYSSFLGWVPFSIGDILYIVLIILLLTSIAVTVRCMLLGQKWRGIYIISRIIIWIGVLYFVFHMLWGFNYYKNSLSDVYNGENYTIEELKVIAENLQSTSIALRSRVEENKEGVFYFNRKSYAKLKPERLKSSKLIYSKIPRKAGVKYSLFSLPMRYFGVVGYFNPFSGEAQIIRKIPSTALPFSMAHEQAHQMGYATENEANFIGYLTCIESNHPSLQYSGNYKALKYVLREIYPLDSVFVKEKLHNFSKGMKRDYQAEIAYSKKYAGKADEVFATMNNAYLKANNQEGLQSYNNFVELLVGYYREQKQPME